MSDDPQLARVMLLLYFPLCGHRGYMRSTGIPEADDRVLAAMARRVCRDCTIEQQNIAGRDRTGREYDHWDVPPQTE